MLACKKAHVTSWIPKLRCCPFFVSVAALLSTSLTAHIGGVPACVSPRRSYAISIAQNRDFTPPSGLPRSAQRHRTVFDPALADAGT